MIHVPLAPFSTPICPFFFRVGSLLKDPNQNWNNSQLPEDDDYEANKEQRDLTMTSQGPEGLQLKQRPRLFQNISGGIGSNGGVYIKKCTLDYVANSGTYPNIIYGYKDCGLQIELAECDVKHRPWENVDIVIELNNVTTGYYNETLSLDSSYFAITPTVTEHGPSPNPFEEVWYKTGYETGYYKRFWSVTGILWRENFGPSGNGPTTVVRIISITPASAYEPPT
jgi:hypothetical protein